MLTADKIPSVADSTAAENLKDLSTIPVKRKSRAASPSLGSDLTRIRLYLCSPVEVEKQKASSSSVSNGTDHAVTISSAPVVEASAEDSESVEANTSQSEADLSSTGRQDSSLPDLDSPATTEAGPSSQSQSVAAATPAESTSPTEISKNSENSTVEEASTSQISSTSKSFDADRVSISYSQNTRRIVINASIISQLRIFRSEGKIEIDLLRNPGESDSKEKSVTKGVVG